MSRLFSSAIDIASRSVSVTRFDGLTPTRTSDCGLRIADCGLSCPNATVPVNAIKMKTQRENISTCASDLAKGFVKWSKGSKKGKKGKKGKKFFLPFLPFLLPTST